MIISFPITLHTLKVLALVEVQRIFHISFPTHHDLESVYIIPHYHYVDDEKIGLKRISKPIILTSTNFESHCHSYRNQNTKTKTTAQRNT